MPSFDEFTPVREKHHRPTAQSAPVKPLDPVIKRNWEKIQKRHSYPVNAIGVKIDSKDKETLRIWREHSIDKYMKEK